MAIASVNPATGETLRTFEALDDAAIEASLSRAASAFRVNRARSFAERASRMRRAAEILEHRQNDLGRLITMEMGKPVKAAVAEVVKCATTCRYYAEHAAEYLADEPVKTDAQESFIRYEPLGPILAVMPWNFPFWQVFRFAAPALMAGNVALLKHASNVPQCALAIEEVFRDAGFTDHEFQTLLIGSQQVERVIADERVRAVTLTGSEPAGASVASIAAKHIKKAVLELGGSDPFIVMPSAALDDAVSTAVKARIVNNGQSCIAAKRFIVHEAIADEFEKRFVSAMEALKVGDPLDESTDIGPLATPQIVDDIDNQVRKSVDAGAQLLTGGKRLGEPRKLLRADGAGAHPRQRAGREGGDLRSGGLALSRSGHRRRHSCGERHSLRPRRVRLDKRSRRNGSLHRRHRVRPGFRQRHGGVRPASAIRRHKALRLRPRARRLRHPRVRECEDGLDCTSR